MSQENARPKRSLVLKYATRRYDGGSEIELIREIERKHAIRQLIRLQHMQMERQRGSMLPIDDDLDEDIPAIGEPGACTTVAELPKPSNAPLPKVTPRPGEPKPAHHGKKSTRVLEALIMGPMEICVGMVGMMTSLLAIITFSYTKNPSLSQQSKSVFHDCFRTFFKGWLDTLTGPGKALQRAVATQ